ncbi:hypothetical protein [Thermococcus sp.]
MEGWELAAWLSIVLGVIYLLAEVLSGGWRKEGTASKIFTLELGVYLITVGILVILQRNGKISPDLYGAVLWAFFLTLVPLSLYVLVKNRVGRKPN